MSSTEKVVVISHLKFSMMLFRSLSTKSSSFAFVKIRIFHCTTNFKMQFLSLSNFK